MDYDEDKIRRFVIAGLGVSEPWRIELEQINYGEKLGVFYRSTDGIKRASVSTISRNDEQIAAALVLAVQSLSLFPDKPLNAPPVKSPYEGKKGRHPDSCTCSRHLNGAHAA